MLTFPDPNVETEYTDPNGSVWEFNGTGWVRQCDCPDGGGGDGGGDEHALNVVLLINGDGEADGSQNIVDVTGKTPIQVNKSAAVSQDQYRYGSGSVFTDSADGAYFMASPVSGFGSQSFTIEAWVYRESAYSSSGITSIVCANTGTNSTNKTFSMHVSDAGWLECGAGQTYIKADQDKFPARQWVHVAASYEADQGGTGNGTIRLFQNGVKVAETAAAYSLEFDQFKFSTTRSNSRQTTQYLDEIRVTQGVARYTDDFSTPDKIPYGLTDLKRAVILEEDSYSQEDSNDADLS